MQKSKVLELITDDHLDQKYALSEEVFKDSVVTIARDQSGAVYEAYVVIEEDNSKVVVSQNEDTHLEFKYPDQAQALEGIKKELNFIGFTRRLIKANFGSEVYPLYV